MLRLLVIADYLNFTGSSSLPVNSLVILARPDALTRAALTPSTTFRNPKRKDVTLISLYIDRNLFGSIQSIHLAVKIDIEIFIVW